MKEISRTRYAEIARRARALPPETTTPSYKWEELVHKMCVSNDARLRDIGEYELGILRKKFPNCIVFSNS